MTKLEKTGKRDLRYSGWHREKLPYWCYCTDLDFIEVRRKEDGALHLVAFIEVKGPSGGLTDFQKFVFEELAKLSGVPFYAVTHNADMTEFIVDERVMTEGEYIEWVKKL